MPSDPRNLPEQEISIKSRAHEVFSREDPDAGRMPTKPFEFYLRETPAFPMSSEVKAILVFAAIIVGLLFLAAVWKLTVRHGPRRVAPPVQRAPVSINALGRAQTTRNVAASVPIAERRNEKTRLG